MKKTRRTTEQIIRILREADTGLRMEDILPQAQHKLPELLQSFQTGIPGPGADIHAQRIASGLLGLA